MAHLKMHTYICVCNLYVCTFGVVSPLFTGVILSHSVSSHETLGLSHPFQAQRQL